MTLITKSSRFAPRAVNEYVYIPTIASATTGKPEPDSSEITAGTFLTREVASIDGWSTSSETVDVGDAATRFVGQISTSVKPSGAPSITFNGSKSGDDARSVFTVGDTGYMLIAPAGVAEDAVAQVWEVEVASVSATPSLDDSFKIVVEFSVPSEPNLNYSIPTGVTVPTS